MKPQAPRVSLVIAPGTRDRLVKRMKYGDSFNKAIQDLLDLADKVESNKANSHKEAPKDSDAISATS